MPQVGIRELKANASEIMRQVREEGVRYVITYRGQPMGVLLPLAEAELEEQLREAAALDDPWDELVAIGQQIGEGWPQDRTGADILSEMRR